MSRRTVLAVGSDAGRPGSSYLFTDERPLHDSLDTDFEHLIPAAELPDPDAFHVVAAPSLATRV